jgi:hypothetical protein
MRFFFLCLFVSFVALLVPNVAVADNDIRSIELRANVVDFYSNRYILTADGNVTARLTDGTVVRGDTFSMDLKLNRFLIAGNVHLDGPNIHQVGAAFAGFPDIERDYVVTEGDVPDRYTYYGLNFKDPHPGRQQPGDAFYFPDLSNEKPYIISNSATIFLKNNLEFPVGARINVLGVYILTPGYVVNYSSNPNFYQNAFSGASFDIGIPFKAAADAMSAAHIRYDPYRGFYTAFDQHFVHNLDYAVFSVDPVTQTQRQYNAILYKRLSPALEARTFFQLSTDSQGLSQPISAASYWNFATNAKVGKYAVGLNTDQYNNDLLAGGVDAPNLYGTVQTSHPFDATLSVQSYEDEFKVFRYIGVPVKFQYRAGFGYNYDSYGLPTLGAGALDTPPNFGGVPYDTIFNHYLGFTAYTSSIRLAKQLSISAKADRLETWYSLPHHLVTTDVSTTLARTPLSVKMPAFLLTYDVLNIGDFWGANQLVAYEPAPDVAVTTFGSFAGQSAFRGFATSRSLSGSMVYTPTPFFALNFTMQNFNVTPAPVPGLGGQAPNQFTADVRVRLAKNILLDVSRIYYFNWAGQGWAPQYGVQFSP